MGDLRFQGPNTGFILKGGVGRLSPMSVADIAEFEIG
jgi:hypothetical protein